MQHHINEDQLDDNPIDIDYSKPVKSRFLFLLFFFGLFIFSWAGCYRLSQESFTPNNDIKVPESSLYSPKYK